jgi:Arc/MetJ family transcription regulator
VLSTIEYSVHNGEAEYWLRVTLLLALDECTTDEELQAAVRAFGIKHKTEYVDNMFLHEMVEKVPAYDVLGDAVMFEEETVVATYELRVNAVMVVRLGGELAEDGKPALLGVEYGNSLND